jgi:hypothetical protein
MTLESQRSFWLLLLLALYLHLIVVGWASNSNVYTIMSKLREKSRAITGTIEYCVPTVVNSYQKQYTVYHRQSNIGGVDDGQPRPFFLVLAKASTPNNVEML